MPLEKFFEKENKRKNTPSVFTKTQEELFAHITNPEKKPSNSWLTNFTHRQPDYDPLEVHKGLLTELHETEKKELEMDSQHAGKNASEGSINDDKMQHTKTVTKTLVKMDPETLLISLFEQLQSH